MSEWLGYEAFTVILMMKRKLIHSLHISSPYVIQRSPFHVYSDTTALVSFPLINSGS